MANQSRRRSASASDARTRARTADAYLEVAKLVLLEDKRVDMPGVAAGLAVLAGIAASDAICASRHGEIPRGEDHRSAADLLRTATPDGARLAAVLSRLVDLKDEAHYGVTVVPIAKARNAVRWAEQLTSRARDEVER